MGYMAIERDIFAYGDDSNKFWAALYCHGKVNFNPSFAGGGA